MKPLQRFDHASGQAQTGAASACWLRQGDGGGARCRAPLALAAVLVAVELIIDHVYSARSIYRYSRDLALDGSKWIRHGIFTAFHRSAQFASEESYVDG